MWFSRDVLKAAGEIIQTIFFKPPPLSGVFFMPTEEIKLLNEFIDWMDDYHCLLTFIGGGNYSVSKDEIIGAFLLHKAGCSSLTPSESENIRKSYDELKTIDKPEVA